jgi:hypothetical protein
MLAAALVLHLLLNAHDGCWVVTNTRITRLPRCDFGPATVEMLTEESSPGTAAGTPPPWRNVPRGGCTTEVRGNDELERRLARAEQERLTAVSQRVTAEQERDQALRERDGARRDLERLRRKMVAAAGHSGGSAPSSPSLRRTGQPRRPRPQRRRPVPHAEAAIALPSLAP